MMLSNQLLVWKPWSRSLLAFSGFLLGGLLIESAIAASAPTAQFQLQGSYYVRTAVFSRDLQWLAVMRAPGGQVEVWRIPAHAKAEFSIARQAGPGAYPLCALLPEAHRLLLATGTNVVIYDLRSGKAEQSLSESALKLRELGVSPNGHVAVGITQGPAPEFALWSLPDGQRITSLPTKSAPWERRFPNQPRIRPNDKPPASMVPGSDWAISPGGQLFAIAFPFGVEFWDLKSGQWVSGFSGWEVPGIRSAASQARPALTSVAFVSSTNLVAVFNQTAVALVDSEPGSSQHPVLLTGINTVPRTSLEIRGLCVSTAAKRFAIAGMRMGVRPAVFAGAGEVVFDVPMYGEIQVWDAGQRKLVSTIQGRSDQKFGCVALDETGKRVAAMTTGVSTRTGPSGQRQNVPVTGYERNPTGTFDVEIWDVP